MPPLQDTRQHRILPRGPVYPGKPLPALQGTLWSMVLAANTGSIQQQKRKTCTLFVDKLLLWLSVSPSWGATSLFPSLARIIMEGKMKRNTDR